MSKTISKIIMGLVFVAGGAFSAYNNFALFSSIFGTDVDGVLSSAAGLALFDVGALGWLLHYAHSARGNAQRAIAATVGVLCLVLTLVAAGTHIILTQTLTTVPEWAGLVAMIAILVGLAINILGLAANHMADPAIITAMRDQAMADEKQDAIQQAQGQVFREALRQTAARVASNAAVVAERLSAEFAQDADREMLAMTSGGDSGHAPALPRPRRDVTVTTAPAMQYAAESEPVEDLTLRSRQHSNGHSNGTAPGK